MKETQVSEIIDKLSKVAGMSEPPFKIKERYLGWDFRDNRLKINVKSDGLSLGDKKKFDDLFTEALKSIDLAGAIPWINFKRSGLTPPSPSNAGLPRLPMKADSKKTVPGVEKVFLVASGKGGVGKSTVSTNLAVSLAKRGHKVGILDGDLWGPSIPSLMGLSGSLAVTDDGMLVPKESEGVKVISFGFMTDHYNPFISKGPLVSKTITKLLFSSAWGNLDYLIIDLPPGTGDAHLALAEGVEIDGAVLVSTPESSALADVHKGLSLFEKFEIPVLGMVENMAFHTCTKCGHQDLIFGNETEVFLEERHIPLLVRLALRPIYAQSARMGAPVVSRDHDILEQFDCLAERIEANW